MLTTGAESKRYVGLDILRIILVLPTIILHIWNIIYGDSHVTFKAGESLYTFYETYIARIFGYSGVFLFCLSFFLYGIREYTLFKKKRWYEYAKILLLFVALSDAQIDFELPYDNPDFFTWDIFSYVLLSYLIISGLSFIKNKYMLYVFTFGFSLFLIPYDYYSIAFSKYFVPPFDGILFSQAMGNSYNGWFLFPWISLPITFYSLGRLVKLPLNYNYKHLIAIFGLAIALLILAPDVAPAGGGLFYQFIFWQSPIYILSRLLVLIGLILWLCKLKFHWIWNVFSLLQWNKNFWFCYILHIGMISSLALHKDYFTENKIVLDWLWVAVFLWIEILVQLLFLSIKVYIWIFKKIYSKIRKQKPSLSSNGNN